MQQACSALLLLLAIAYGAHLIWAWLSPLLPVVPVAVVFFVVFRIIFTGRRR
jgi:hypothetical protein